MGRIRTIKPEFFKHSGLYDLEQEEKIPARVAFCGLWTCCDRAGRFKWRPRELKIDILPYDECDFSRVLDALASRGFIVKYATETEFFGYIPSWEDHQFINNKEPLSSLPNPLDCQPLDASITRDLRVGDANGSCGVKEGKGREGKKKQKKALIDPSPDVREIYLAYPKHESCQDAYAAIERVLGIRTKEQLLSAIEGFKQKLTREKTDDQYIPLPSSWFNKGRYDDEGLIPAPKQRFVFEDGTPVPTKGNL